jgi:hypothetical protein
VVDVISVYLLWLMSSVCICCGCKNDNVNERGVCVCMVCDVCTALSRASWPVQAFVLEMAGRIATRFLARPHLASLHHSSFLLTFLLFSRPTNAPNAQHAFLSKTHAPPACTASFAKRTTPSPHHPAVDGPAPRAKMNQQRARRFRAAKEKREGSEQMRLRRELLEQQGKTTLPTGDGGFDSNCITPGTEFMARLSLALEWYVLDRLDSDPGWSGVLAVLSDATIPGEGEHKIMDFIREQRKCPEHNPNLRHVLYGADADLIMLGLASHEPNFTILREEFHRPPKRPCALCGRRGCRPARYAQQRIARAATIQSS